MHSQIPTDWNSFTPRERAVIAFARRDGQILLIHKKRGLGAGKVNGPGGRIEADETPEHAAIRETREEVGLELTDLREQARLRFRFSNGFSLFVHVFTTFSFSGDLVETDEADPFWVLEHEIPYERMWADDAHWLPEVLAGRYVDGWFDFDGDAMLSSAVEIRER
ncbi:MAG: 8-oxo-dGTP diphosphatase [Spirochaetota bacterium]